MFFGVVRNTIVFEWIKVNLKISQFPILDKERKEVEYVKHVYKRRIQSEADSFFNQEEQPDTIFAQDIFFVYRISI